MNTSFGLVRRTVASVVIAGLGAIAFAAVPSTASAESNDGIAPSVFIPKCPPGQHIQCSPEGPHGAELCYCVG